MLANQVYQILDTLKKGQISNLDRDSYQWLKNKELISELSSPDYSSRLTDASRLPSIEETVNNIKTNLDHNRDALAALDEKLTSKWHRGWSYLSHFGSSVLVSEKDQKKRLEEEIIQGTEELKSETTEKNRLEALKKDLEGYVNSNYGYLKLSNDGNMKSRQIGARISRLDGVSYDDFESEVFQVKQAITIRYQRFNQFYEFLKKQGYDNDESTIQHALSLSGDAGDIHEIYNKSVRIDDFLDKALKEEHGYGKEDTERLKTIITLLGLEGDIATNVNELKRLFIIALERGNSNSYGTLSEQALCLKIPHPTPEQKYDRFDKMQDALNERGWIKGSAATCYISANLAKRKGEIVQIADEFRTLEKKIVEGGHRDCVESGIAALILFDAPGTSGEKANKFDEAFTTMQKYGWKKNTDYYAAAAIVSLIPGTIEENVQWLDYVTEWMKADGFKYGLTNMALPIISGGYRELLKLDSAPSFIGSSIIDSFQLTNQSSVLDLTTIVSGLAVLDSLSSYGVNTNAAGEYYNGGSSGGAGVGGDY